MIATAVKTHKTYSAAIIISCCWLIIIDQLNCFYFGGAAECSGRKCFCQQLKWVTAGSYPTIYFTHHMNNMAIILNVFIMSDSYLITYSAQIISCKINKHHMLGILLFITF